MEAINTWPTHFQLLIIGTVLSVIENRRNFPETDNIPRLCSSTYNASIIVSFFEHIKQNCLIKIGAVLSIKLRISSYIFFQK